MNLRKIFSIIGVTLLAVSATAGKDSLDISDKIVASQSVSENFRKQVYTNPAARFFQKNYSLTSIGFNGIKDNTSEYRAAQFGKGNSFWGLNAKSHYVIDKNNIVWGEATYKKGCREDVIWNETSDFNLLYPYVMADEKGGDLKYEQYFFKGGYAGRYKRWIFGASMYYRALDEYRTKDPRPNNVVADLHAQLGVGFTFNDYSVNLGLFGSKYKQTNELKYFNEIGASKEYHLTGLGNGFVRFSGACNNVFYKGNDLGISIELVPVTNNGISFSLKYSRFNFDKILSDLNKLALNEVSENKLIGEAAWTGHIGKNTSYGIKADTRYYKRKGYDNLFGDATNNVFPKIGSSQMYNSKTLFGKLSGFYESTIAKHFPLAVSPYVSYGSFESTHAESHNKFKTNSYCVGTLLQGSYKDRLNILRLSINAEYRIAGETELNVPDESFCHQDLFDTMKHTASYFNEDELNTKIALRYQYNIKNKNISCFIETAWVHRLYLNDENDNMLILKTGINI